MNAGAAAKYWRWTVLSLVVLVIAVVVLTALAGTEMAGDEAWHDITGDGYVPDDSSASAGAQIIEVTATGAALVSAVAGAISALMGLVALFRRKPNPRSPGAGPRYVQQIEDLARLRDAGIISRKEFDAKKHDLLNRI